MAKVGLRWWQRWRCANEWRIPMAELTDTQLVILSAASQREDRGVELPANVQGKAAGQVVAKLVRASLLEEIKASGSLPVWRRDNEDGAIALRITNAGLAAIEAADEAMATSEENDSRLASTGEAARSVRKAISFRKQISVAAQKSARKRHRPCPSRKLYPRVVMMQSRQNRHSNDSSMSLDRSTERRILF